MKNKIKHIAIGLSAVLTIVSCKNDDFLDKFPPDAFTEPSYFKTEQELSFFANRFYGSLPLSILQHRDVQSDNMVPNSPDDFLFGTYTVPSSGGGWDTGAWNGIRNCNFFLENYQKVSGTTKEKYAAEVRFFRALYYWEKVVRFGDVPLILKKVGDASPEIYGPREPHKKVMDEVLKDLNFAIEHLPEKANAEAGRLHKDAALALKSRIALWEGTFRKYHNLGDERVFLEAAVDASEKLMAKGYEIYSTGKPNEDYRNLFIQDNLAGNKEAIFHRHYLRAVETGRHEYSRSAKGSNNGCSKDFMEYYLFKDGKPISTTSYTYDDSTPSKEAENRDPRYAQTVATPGFVKTSSTPPVIVNLPEIGTPVTTTGYWFIKGMSNDPKQEEAYSSDTDMFIFRYAEVLLNYAEAKYELGTLSQADLDRTINKIRDRVAMPHLTMDAVADANASDYGYDVAPILYEIRRERRVELVGEGFRFNDILRWKAGKLLNNPKTIKGMKLTDELKAEYNKDAINKLPVDNEKYLIVYPAFPNGRTWNDKMYLYPIPTDELKLVGYKQNPGWD
ncbi:RagB/SusD family nutrient uptake outer membrane protein [Capnocytophaga canis]|uniref:RagB/SusD family nutrient uptake outer membrane protein n=1 Tax=Capnocytophaga TaxID=1016 RepID=UPI000BB185D4|nr:RagB/SusD family nutrient uptake outer membrane protein [Capnocytophaga sp. H2931]ATA75696.1 RagB/SusD family nutrient uptake outer membrane protein [Capnocytophaga sp. H2931]